MKRLTILFDDETLYRSIKAEAAREGRPVKDVVEEALSAWLEGRNGTSSARRDAALQVLRELTQLRSSLSRTDAVQTIMEEIRDERP